MSNSTTETTITHIQTRIITKIFNFNTENTSSTKDFWKVLVFDAFSQNLISLLLKVNDLRDNGITLHLPLFSKRAKLEDVPAIYIMQPSLENLNKLLEDLKQDLYSNYYVNFTSSLPRELLETFAEKCVLYNCFDKIGQIYDQYIQFYCLERNMFSLNLTNSYYSLNQNKSDELVQKTVDSMTEGLLSVFVSIGQVPYIKATVNNAAELVAQKLDFKIKDLLRSRSSELFKEDILSDKRPMLLVVDRSVDFKPMVSHSWSYQSLISDLFEINFQKIYIKNKEGQKRYDLDVNDFFWNKNGSLPFPQMVDEIDLELTKYKKDADEITKANGLDSIDDVMPEHESTRGVGNSAQHLKAAIQQLPELTARKAVIDVHMNIANGLIEIIKERQIDTFFQLEDSIQKQTKQTVIEALKDRSKTIADRYRLFIIFYLTNQEITKTEINEMMKILTDEGCETYAFDYLHSVHKILKMDTANQLLVAGSPGVKTHTKKDLFNKFSNLSTKLKEGSSYYGQLVSGIKNLLPKQQDLPLTRIMSSAINNAPGVQSLSDTKLNEYDPKSKRSKYKAPISQTQTLQPKPQPVNKYSMIVVFVVGGGSYIEYENLIEHTKRNNISAPIIYGSTEIINAEKFMKQLDALGKEQH